MKPSDNDREDQFQETLGSMRCPLPEPTIEAGLLPRYSAPYRPDGDQAEAYQPLVLNDFRYVLSLIPQTPTHSSLDAACGASPAEWSLGLPSDLVFVLIEP